MLRFGGLDNSLYFHQQYLINSLERKLETYLHYEDKYKKEKEHLIKEVENLIFYTQGEEKIKLIQIKQLIFSEKFDKINLMLLNTKNEKNVIKLKKLKTRCYSLKERYIAHHQRVEEKEKRFIINRARNSSEFKKGLLIASPQLLEALQKYESCSTKKQRRIFTGVLKYYLRMAYKTSPFSYFTPINIVDEEQLGLDGGDGTISEISINRKLFFQIISVVKQSNFFRKNLRVRLNPTIYEKGGKYYFYKCNENKDLCNVLKKNVALDYFYSLLLDPRSSLSVKDLTKLIEEKFDTTVVATKVIKDLEDYGFFEITTGLNLLSNTLIEDLENFLIENSSSKDAKFFKVSFNNIRKNLIEKNCHSSTLNSSKERIKVLRDTLKKVCLKLVELVRSDSCDDNLVNNFELNLDSLLKSLFYEDIFINRNAKISVESVHKSINQIIEFLQSISALDGGQDKHYEFEEFVKERFSGRRRIPMLEVFYSYANHLQGRGIDNYDVLNSIYHKFSMEVDQLYEANFSDLESPWVVNIDEEALKAFKKIIPIWKKPPKLKRESKSLYFQFFQNDSHFNLVVNGFAVGYGKWHSRFINSFSETELQEYLNFNYENTNSEFLNVENVDAMCGNANVRPMLFEFEIHVPGAHHISSNEKKKMHLKDLDILVNNDAIYLYNKVFRKKICVFDLGFYSPIGRSFLFSFLNLFNPKTQLNLSYFNSLIINKYKSVTHFIKIGEGYLRFQKFPRITYLSSTVFERASWLLKVEDLLKLSSENSTIIFFQIKKQLGIPDEVFVHFQIERFLKGSKISNGDHYKPMYFNLNSPVLLSFFLTTLKSINNEYVKIVEMLPNNKEILDSGSNRVTEFMYQFAY